MRTNDARISPRTGTTPRPIANRRIANSGFGDGAPPAPRRRYGIDINRLKYMHANRTDPASEHAGTATQSIRMRLTSVRRLAVHYAARIAGAGIDASFGSIRDDA